MTTRSKAKDNPDVQPDGGTSPVAAEDVDGDGQGDEAADADPGDEGDPEQAHADREARETARHRLQLQYGEYGQWIAGSSLHDDSGALQFAAGHPIPAEMVDEDGRVVIARHRCHHTPDVRCDLFNTPELWSEPGIAVRPAGFQE